MLENIAKYCTLELMQKDIIDRKKEKIFVYGFQLFFSTALTIVSMLIISIITRNFVYGVIYLFVFMSLRITANGYHASTFGGCFLITISIYLIYLFLINNYLKYSLSTNFNILLLGLSSFYIWKKAPIEHPNHKLTIKKRITNQFAARIIIFGYMVLILLLTYLHYIKIAYAMSVTIYIVTLMMVVKNKDF